MKIRIKSLKDIMMYLMYKYDSITYHELGFNGYTNINNCSCISSDIFKWDWIEYCGKTFEYGNREDITYHKDENVVRDIDGNVLPSYSYELIQESNTNLEELSKLPEDTLVYVSDRMEIPDNTCYARYLYKVDVNDKNYPVAVYADGCTSRTTATTIRYRYAIPVDNT